MNEKSKLLTNSARYEALKKIYLSSLDIRCNGNRHELRDLKTPAIISAHQLLEQWVTGSYLNPQEAPFQILDFFSGCGGATLGFASLNMAYPLVKILGGFDIDKEALTTFQKNFDAPGIEVDIRELHRGRALETLVEKLNGYDPRKPLILIGCAPCQGFTSHRKKNWSVEDERNSLVGIFAKLAVKLNPLAIIMENVPEMFSVRYWKYYQVVKTTLNRAGYTLKQGIFNAAEYGVPQERFRALIVAMRKNFIMPQPILTPELFMTVKDAIGKLPPVEPGDFWKKDLLHRSAKHRASTVRTIRAIPKNGGSRPYGVGPKCLDKIKGFYDVYGRLAWDKPAITITHYARNPASGRFVHPEQNRGLTIREAALLQSFPNKFQFIGSFDSIFKQIGEAVAPKFAAAVAVNIIIELLSEEPNTTISNIEKSGLFQHPINNSYSSVIAGIKMGRHKK